MDNGLFINGGSNGFSKINVVKRSNFVIDHHKVVGGCRFTEQGNPLCLGKTGQIRRLYLNDHVHFSGLQSHRPGGAFRNDLPDDLLDRSRAAEIIFKGLKFKAFTPVPGHQLIGAGSDGLFVKIMSAFDQIRGQDKVAVMGQVGKKAGLRAIRRNFYRIIIHNLHRLGRRAVLGNLGRFLAEFKRGLYILGRHLFSIMEQNALL